MITQVQLRYNGLLVEQLSTGSYVARRRDGSIISLVLCNCRRCGKTVAKQTHHSKQFCSKPCKFAWLRSRDNPQYGTRKLIEDGNGCAYWYVFIPDHPATDRAGYVREHRLVLETALGRYLTADEEGHHIDCQTTNNAPGNLIALTKHEHRMAHASLLPCVAELLAGARLRFNRETKLYETYNAN